MAETWRNKGYLTNTGSPSDTDTWDTYYNIANIADVVATKGKNWTLAQLNALNDSNFSNLTWNKTLNDTGYQNWNLTFNSLGMNDYFGYSEDVNDFMGPSTWNRKTFLTNLRNTYNSKDKTISISNNQKVFYNPETNKWELYNPAKYHVSPLTFDLVQKGTKKERFFGWIPHLSNYFSNLRTANQNLRLAKQLNPPLKTAALKSDIVTDDYALQSAYTNNAAKMRSLGNQNLTSNAELNLQQKLAYDSKASELEEKAALAKSQKYNQEIQQAQDVANANTQALTDTVNANKQAIFAAEQYKVQAEQSANLQKNQARNELVSGIWNDLTQFNQIQGLNDSHEKNRELKKNILTQKQDLINQFNKDFGDYTTSEEWRLWKKFVYDNPGLFEQYENTDDWYKSNWTTNEYAKKFREQWEKRKTDAQTSISQSIADLNLNYQLGTGPLYYTGQPDLWPFENKKHSSPAFQKKGGKVDRLSDYLKIVQKEQSDYRKNNQRARATELRKLEKELEQINQKQVLLLREIFG